VKRPVQLSHCCTIMSQPTRQGAAYSAVKAVVTCAIYCMQRAAIVACNNCRLSNVFENIHEAKVLQPMTAFGGIT